MKFWVSTMTGGGLVESESASVSVLDHGFTVGDGVFETLKTVAGRPFALGRHLDRLYASAAITLLTMPERAVVAEAVAAVLDQAEVREQPVGRMRITVSSGTGALGSSKGNGWTLVVVWTPAQAWPETASIAVTSIRRNEQSAIAGAKTTSYVENVMALVEAHQRGADEGIVLNLAGNVCEGTGSNIFIVKNDVVITPPLSSGCLAGITRALAIAWLPTEIRFAELDFSHAELLAADEIFLTSSTRDIQPVSMVDGHAIAAPGPKTRSTMAAFAANVGSELG